MTEAEWNACADPELMLEFLRGKASDRKLRLFAVACCRHLGNLITDKYSRKALTIAERYADGEVSAEKLRFVWGDARRAAQVASRQDRQTAEATPMWAVSLACESDIERVLQAVSLTARCMAFPFDSAGFAAAQCDQATLLREIISNPFRLVALDPAWLAWNDGAAPKLAQAIYDNRAFDRLPLLADASEDAGCTDAAILAHCRSPGEHVRGCWVVDMVLGKA